MTEELPTPPGPFFRFPDELTALEALETAGLFTEDGDLITASHTPLNNCALLILLSMA